MRGCLFFSALVCTIVGIGPLLSALLAYQIASSLGCTLDEGSVHPCLLAGRDIGDLLYVMGVMGWLMLVTIWLLPVAPIMWIAYAVARHRAKRTQGE
jgi:uncharacterized membrane protein